jgi:hypothetical protein
MSLFVLSDRVMIFLENFYILRIKPDGFFLAFTGSRNREPDAGQKASVGQLVDVTGRAI